MVAKHILKDNSKSYSKGILAESLEFVMGKGLIPADGKVSASLKLINEIIDDLINICKRMVEDEDVQFHEEYVNERDPSILHFLLASGDDVSSKQLRDDLMTMLIAGHETSAAVLTWAFYLLAQILFDAKQWDDLVQLFKQEFCKLYGMTLQPLLNIYLQAGLISLKTPFCYEENCTKEDPLSQENFRTLASSLPFSKHIHSKLVCYISKELMDEHNPPLVLPNGYVYSTKALEEMAKRNNGKVTCPRTGLVCNLTDLAKAFIS